MPNGQACSAFNRTTPALHALTVCARQPLGRLDFAHLVCVASRSAVQVFYYKPTFSQPLCACTQFSTQAHGHQPLLGPGLLAAAFPLGFPMNMQKNTTFLSHTGTSCACTVRHLEGARTRTHTHAHTHTQTHTHTAPGCQTGARSCTAATRVLL